MTTKLDILLSAVYLAVGMALFAATVVLAVLFHYRITPRIPRIRCNNNWFPPPPINYVLPQQPPPAHFYPPVPPRPPAVNNHPGIFHGRDEEDVPGEMEVGIQEGSDGSTTGTGIPVIQHSSDGSSHHSSAGATPYRARDAPSAADLARYLVRLGLGTTGPSGSSTAQQPTGSRLRNTPVLPATSGPHDIFVSSTSELDLVWDNLNLPHTAFFPPRENPYRWGTAEYPSVIHWDEPVRITTRSPTPPEQTRESTPEFPPRVTPDRLAIPRRRREPPRSVVEVAEELNQFDRDRRQAEHERAEELRRIDEGNNEERIPQVDSRGDTVYHTPADSDTSTERLPDEEPINGILYGGSPSPSPVPSFPTPNTPPARPPR